MGVDFRTQAIHAGYEPLDNGRAAVPPIYASAAFDLGDAARGDALAGGDIDGFEYSRVANPTVDALEKRLAALRTIPPKGRSTYIIKDVRLFLNSVDRGLRLMHAAGIPARWNREDTDGEIQLTISIPKRREARERVGTVTEL